PHLAEPPAGHGELLAAHARTAGRAALRRRLPAGPHTDQLRRSGGASERDRRARADEPMIEIARTYTFDAPRDRVWQLLMDTQALSSCIPGCESLDPDPETPQRYAIRLSVKLAAVMGTYDGSVQIVDVLPMQSYGLLAEGRGHPGFVKGR